MTKLKVTYLAACRYVRPAGGAPPPLALRLTRASLILAVCRHDAHRGLELIASVQVR